MKMDNAHIVPLPRQAVELLRSLQPLTGSGRYVFGSLRAAAVPMSENTYMDAPNKPSPHSLLPRR